MVEPDISHALSPDALGKKVGPLPVWGYAVIVAGGVYGLKKYRASKTVASVGGSLAASDSAGSGSAHMPITATTTQADNSGASSNSASAYNPDGSYNRNGSGTSSNFATPTSNQDWLVQATAEVASLNSWGAYQIDGALRAYLSGSALDPTQQPIVNTAIKMVGSPPEAVSPAPTAPYIPVSPTPTPAPTPKPIHIPEKPAIPSMYAINSNRLDHKLAPISLNDYRAQYPGGLEQNAAQTRYINARAAQPGAVIRPQR